MTWKGDNFSFQDRYKKICWIILRVSCQKHHSKTALHAPKVLFSEQIILQPSRKTVQSIFHLLLRQDCVDRHKRNIWVNQNKVLSVIAFPAWLFNISCTKKAVCWSLQGPTKPSWAKIIYTGVPTSKHFVPIYREPCFARLPEREKRAGKSRSVLFICRLSNNGKSPSVIFYLSKLFSNHFPHNLKTRIWMLCEFLHNTT